MARPKAPAELACLTCTQVAAGQKTKQACQQNTRAVPSRPKRTRLGQDKRRSRALSAPSLAGRGQRRRRAATRPGRRSPAGGGSRQAPATGSCEQVRAGDVIVACAEAEPQERGPGSKGAGCVQRRAGGRLPREDRQAAHLKATKRRSMLRMRSSYSARCGPRPVTRKRMRG